MFRHVGVVTVCAVALVACGPRYEVVAPTEECTPCEAQATIAANTIQGAVDCTPSSGKAADLIACAKDAQKQGHASHGSLKFDVADMTGGAEVIESADGKVVAIHWRGASQTPGACSAEVDLQRCDRIPADVPVPVTKYEGCGPRTTVCQSKPVKHVLRTGRVSQVWCAPMSGGPLLCGSERAAVEAEQPGVHAVHPDSPLQCTEDGKLLRCVGTR